MGSEMCIRDRCGGERGILFAAGQVLNVQQGGFCMQRKDLALRVLSTAAIMSIVTSIAAPAFADIYYIGNGDINVETKTDENGEYVQVTQGGTTYKDESGEIVIKDGTSEKDATLKEEKRAEGTQAKPAVAPAAGAATLELEAAGTAAAAGPAAGESQPDPDDAFNLSEDCLLYTSPSPRDS